MKIDPLDIRNTAILEMLYSCGLRVSELINVRCSDLFFEEGLIKVVGKGNKRAFCPYWTDWSRINSEIFSRTG